MEKISLTEQKVMMLEILIYLDQVISSNNLRYSLWGGSMLGAVRHKGFIPWDDDIDISLPRRDYEKLINILKTQELYKLYDYSSQQNYTWGWAKLSDSRTVDNKKKYFKMNNSHGVFVDIIPIDGLPSDDKDIIKYRKKLYWLNLLIKSTQYPSCASSISFFQSSKKLFLLFPVSLYAKLRGGKEKLIEEMEILSKTYSLEQSNKCAHLLSRYKSSLGYPSSIWDEITEYEFEGHYFKGIADSSTYLNAIYGENYMQTPPKDKQITHEEHEFYRIGGGQNEYCNDNGKWKRGEDGPEYS